jgi:succinyl-diaminopimelate desuccinylase
LQTADLALATDVRARIRTEVAAARDDLVRMTRALVRAPSPNPPGDVTAAADVAETLCREIEGVAVERFEPAPGIVNLVARVVAGEPGRRFVLNGHLDTFPLGDEASWTVPPFEGTFKEGRLYGRGVSDMKAGMAASILAARSLARHREAWRGELVLTFAGDEENMGSLGTGWLLEHVPHARGDAMLSGDVGSPRVARFGEKGLLWVRLTATGRPAHGAHVHKGVNAVDRLRRALDILSSTERLPVEVPAAISRAMEAARPVSEPLSGEGEADTLGRVTVNIGLVQGGVSPNLIPAKAAAEADIRLPVGIEVATVEAYLRRELALIEGVELEVLRRYPATFTPPDHELVRLTLAAAEETLGTRPVANMRVGASDARLYRLAGVPSVVFGCTPYNMGGPDEYVEVAEAAAVAEVHTLTAFDFLAT